jgi:putative nucleotidyltransferase with HDIG domain
VKNEKEKVLVVDDDKAICQLCEKSLQLNGYQVITTSEPEQVFNIIKSDPVDLVLTDIKMPKMDGIEVLKQIKAISPDIAVVVMTAYASMKVAINAVNFGAYNFISKPFHLNEMLLAIKNALERKHLLKEIIRLKTLVNLFKITEQISGTLEISQLLQTMIKAVIKETNSEKAAIFYRDDETNELYVRSSIGIDEVSVEKMRFSMGQGIVGSVFQEKKPVLIDDITKESKYNSNGVEKVLGTNMLIVPMQNKDKTFGVLGLFRDNNHIHFTEADKDVASLLTTQASIALDNAELILDYEILFLESMKSLARTLDERDPYTHGHSHRVAKLAIAIGQELGLADKALEELKLAGILHDIGKIGIRDEILLKPYSLTKEEYEIIKTHPEKGYNILKPIQRLSVVVEAVYTHHEWCNGSGYPRGLKGADIPLSGSIIAVADAYDTIVTDRPYRSGKDHNEAIHILKMNANTQFHPEIVSAIEKVNISQLNLDQIDTLQ